VVVLAEAAEETGALQLLLPVLLLGSSFRWEEEEEGKEEARHGYYTLRVGAASSRRWRVACFFPPV
jgi:hypothetical protein